MDGRTNERTNGTTGQPKDYNHFEVDTLHNVTVREFKQKSLYKCENVFVEIKAANWNRTPCHFMSIGFQQRSMWNIVKEHLNDNTHDANANADRPTLRLDLTVTSGATRCWMARGSHSFTCHPHVYPGMEWAILRAFCKHSPDGVARARWCTSKSAYYSSIDPERIKGWVGLGWLVTYRNKVPPPGVEPGHVIHPSTNRARRRVTSLIRPTPLPLRHAATRW